jgi:hypothetical protein
LAVASGLLGCLVSRAWGGLLFYYFKKLMDFWTIFKPYPHALDAPAM